MNCHEAKERLLEDRRTAAVSRHLIGCADCDAFAREVKAGGRDLADAFLSVTPSPGFEQRVAARLGDAEISVAAPRRPGLRSVVLAAVFLLLGGGVVSVFFWPEGNREPRSAPVSAPAPKKKVPVITAPEVENPLYLRLVRRGSAAETELTLDFAGEKRTTRLTTGLDDELLRAWAQGARRAEVVVAPDIPGREIDVLIDGLERTGFSYELIRRK